jgi:hypothetical protein
MKTILWMILSCAFIAEAQQVADTSAWKHSVTAGVTATQVSYTDWAQGGENALAWTATLDGKSVLEPATYSWATTYNFAYGNTKLGTQSVRKTDDKIDIASTFTYKLGVFINPYVAATFKTQFTKGYSYDALGNAKAISDFLDPAFITQSAGAGYQPIPEVKTRLGAALREIVTYTFTQYSGGEKTEVEGGLESVTEVDARLEENLFFKAKLELFSAFKKMQEVVVRSDNTLTAKISKYFSTNINVQLIQERPITPRTQVKQTIALGFSYVLF